MDISGTIHCTIAQGDTKRFLGPGAQIPEVLHHYRPAATKRVTASFVFLQCSFSPNNLLPTYICPLDSLHCVDALRHSLPSCFLKTMLVPILSICYSLPTLLWDKIPSIVLNRVSPPTIFCPHVQKHMSNIVQPLPTLGWEQKHKGKRQVAVSSAGCCFCK